MLSEFLDGRITADEYIARSWDGEGTPTFRQQAQQDARAEHEAALEQERYLAGRAILHASNETKE
jgi:hypothetical protein